MNAEPSRCRSSELPRKRRPNVFDSRILTAPWIAKVKQIVLFSSKRDRRPNVFDSRILTELSIANVKHIGCSPFPRQFRGASATRFRVHPLFKTLVSYSREILLLEAGRRDRTY
jgi:hypothetical protein